MITDTKKITYKVLSLDVWGHEHHEEPNDEYECPGGARCEGWQINNWFNAGSVEFTAHPIVYNRGTEHEFLSYDFSDNHVKEVLMESGYFQLHVKPDDIEIDSYAENWIDILDAKTGEPLYQLELVEEHV